MDKLRIARYARRAGKIVWISVLNIVLVCCHPLNSIFKVKKRKKKLRARSFSGFLALALCRVSFFSIF